MGDFMSELSEFGFDAATGDKPVVAARDAKTSMNWSLRVKKMFWSSSMHLGADIVRNLHLSTMNWVRKWPKKLSRSLKWTLQPMTFLLSLMSRASPLFIGCLKAPRSQFLITEVGSWTTLLNTLLKMLLTS